MYYIIIIAVVLALLLAFVNFKRVVKESMGSQKMMEIAKAIKIGARTFLFQEYRAIIKVAILIAIILCLLIDWYVGICFILGAFMSALAGYIGMNIATESNVRVTAKANDTKDIGKTLQLAFTGGSVMGLSVGAFALLGLLIVYLVFGVAFGQLAVIQIETNYIGISFIPFTMSISGYALGCSVIAMFNRVGGGIYTKAADMGADLVGKTEANIPEDDPRNPATIADNVGDNVGDVAGLGADLLESFVGALISSVVLVSYIYFTNSSSALVSKEMVDKLIVYPIAFAAIGLISCVIGISILIRKKHCRNPKKDLNTSTYISALLTIVLTGIFTYYVFSGTNYEIFGFNLGALSPWISAVFGIVAGIVIGELADYYTSYDHKPTKQIAKSSIEGPALTITEGLSVGMKSVLFPVIVLAIAILFSYWICGLFGVAMVAIGMLSFVSATVSVDTYGPIADNAGGIAEMSELEPEVRKITDKLDSVGNTTAAVGKGFAIGSASLAALSLLASYMYSQATVFDTNGYELVLNIINTKTLSGAIFGAALPFFFSGILINSVSSTARLMVLEVRRQFKERPDILLGKAKPDYKNCIAISSKGSLKEMQLPAIISVLVPIVCGFIFGEEFVGGLLLGTTLSGIMLALFTANSGGAWDNAKKYVETGGVAGYGKGSDVHKATVIGDTVGDPLKDTVGPSLNILIKIMSVVSLIMVSVFSKFNILSLFM